MTAVLQNIYWRTCNCYEPILADSRLTVFLPKKRHLPGRRVEVLRRHRVRQRPGGVGSTVTSRELRPERGGLLTRQGVVPERTGTPVIIWCGGCFEFGKAKGGKEARSVSLALLSLWVFLFVCSVAYFTEIFLACFLVVGDFLSSGVTA